MSVKKRVPFMLHSGDADWKVSHVLIQNWGISSEYTMEIFLPHSSCLPNLNDSAYLMVDDFYFHGVIVQITQRYSAVNNEVCVQLVSPLKHFLSACTTRIDPPNSLHDCLGIVLENAGLREGIDFALLFDKNISSEFWYHQHNLSTLDYIRFILSKHDLIYCYRLCERGVCYFMPASCLPNATVSIDYLPISGFSQPHEVTCEVEYSNLEVGHHLTLRCDSIRACPGDVITLSCDSTAWYVTNLNLSGHVDSVSENLHLEVIMRLSDKPIALTKSVKGNVIPSMLWQRAKVMPSDSGYHVSLHADSANHHSAKASNALYCSGDDYAFHYPLIDNSEVVVAFEDDLQQKPIILGALTTRHEKSLVTNRNSDEHILRTTAGSQLVFKEQDVASSLSLSTDSFKNKLVLERGQFFLGSMEGSLDLESFSLMRFSGTKGHHLQVENDLNIFVDESFSIINNRGDLSVYTRESVKNRSEQSIDFYADSYNWSAGKVMRFSTKKTGLLEAKETIQISCDGGDQTWQVDTGVLRFSAEKSLILQVGKSFLSINSNEMLLSTSGCIHFNGDLTEVK